MKQWSLTLVVAALAVAGATQGSLAQQPSPGPHPDIRLFFVAASPDRDQARAALAEIAKVWRNGYAGIIWDLLRFFEPPQQPDLFVPAAPTERTPFPSGRRESLSTQVFRRLMTFLEDQTGERFSNDLLRLTARGGGLPTVS